MRWWWLCAIFLSGQALARNHVVTVSAAQLPHLINSPLGDVAVYRSKAGVWEAIPFQIDEKIRNVKQDRDEYVLDNSGNKIVDERDELSLMSGDLGERVRAAPFAIAYELAIADRYVYIGRDPKIKLPASSRSYVTYDPAQDRVRTARYQTAFLPTTPLVQHELLLHNGAVISNILDRLKMRFFLDLRLFFNMKVSEETITSKVAGYTLGPIRLIRRVLLYQKIGPIRVTPKAVSDFIFSHDQVHIPSTVYAPFDPKAHLKDSSIGFGGFDFSKQVYGSLFYGEHNQTPVRIDGAMDDAERDLVKDNVQWWVLTGKQGHIVGKVTLDERLQKAGLQVHLYYDDNIAVALPPEKEVGQSMVGFSIKPGDIPQGSFQLWIDQYFPPKGFRPGEESVYIQSPAAVVVKEK